MWLWKYAPAPVGLTYALDNASSDWILHCDKCVKLTFEVGAPGWPSGRARSRKTWHFLCFECEMLLLRMLSLFREQWAANLCCQVEANRLSELWWWYWMPACLLIGKELFSERKGFKFFGSFAYNCWHRWLAFTEVKLLGFGCFGLELRNVFNRFEHIFIKRQSLEASLWVNLLNNSVFCRHLSRCLRLYHRFRSS